MANQKLARGRAEEAGGNDGFGRRVLANKEAGLFTAKFELNVGHNRLHLKDCNSNRCLERTALTPFSSDHVLVADPEAFSALAMLMFREHPTVSKWKIPSVEVSSADRKLLKVEVMAIQKVLNDAGCSNVTFVESAVA
jgi:hypothetical protein